MSHKTQLWSLPLNGPPDPLSLLEDREFDSHGLCSPSINSQAPTPTLSLCRDCPLADPNCDPSPRKARPVPPSHHRMLNPTSEPLCWKPDGILS